MNVPPVSVERVQKCVVNFGIYRFLKKRPIYPILPYPFSINVYPIFRDLRQLLIIVTLSLTSEVLPSNLQLYTSSFVEYFISFCRLLTIHRRIFYKVFGRYPLCCVRIGLDWIQLSGGLVDRGFGLDWIFSTQSISYSVGDPMPSSGRSRSGQLRRWLPDGILRHLLHLPSDGHRQRCGRHPLHRRLLLLPA